MIIIFFVLLIIRFYGLLVRQNLIHLEFYIFPLDYFKARFLLFQLRCESGSLQIFKLVGVYVVVEILFFVQHPEAVATLFSGRAPGLRIFGLFG